MSDWLRNEIATGLQMLVVLRLPGTPPEEMIAATGKVWIEAASSKAIAWEESLDLQRVRSAFVALAAACERWPAPEALFRHMPARVYAQRQLAQSFDPVEFRKNRVRIRQIINQLKQQHTASFPPLPPRGGGEGGEGKSKPPAASPPPPLKRGLL